MKKEAYQNEIKAIKLLQERVTGISDSHLSIKSDIDLIKEQLADLGASEFLETSEFFEKKEDYIERMSCERSLTEVNLIDIYQQANKIRQEPITLNAILTASDWHDVDQKLDSHISDFNTRYGLDKWDYAIAVSCGLFAAMLDLLFIKAPPKPTLGWSQEVDGVFNKWVQQAFNKALPPDLSKMLSKISAIGAPDSSTIVDLIGAPPKTLNPINHRLRSLAHDPVLGFIFGVLDMMNNTCTVVKDGKIYSFPSTKAPVEGNIFQLLGRMFGHLLSDVNAPSANGNRGMGLPAPFMGLLRMFEGIPIGSSDFGKQIEFMYVKGYDFRQFVVSSVPMAIMEVMLRSFYVIKQMKLYNAPFGESMLDTIPTRMNPRFRMMLAFSYGTSTAVNAGKMYVTQDILNANYASWMGFAWNGFHALKWALLDRQLKLWEGIETKEIEEIESLIEDIEQLGVRAAHLPI
jgi:hypothetical protein